MTILTPQEFLDSWQANFGELEAKWHRRFLDDPITRKILEFDSEEILHCLRNPQQIVEYVGLYRNAVRFEGKKLIHILAQLESEKAARERKPLGTFSKRVEASGSLSGEGSWASTGINNNLSHDE